jgi:di/tricarboxylate transporter
MNYIDIISILFLFVVVAIGFVKKCNIGVLAIGSALILARLGGLSDSKVLAGFDAKLFITLVGVSFLFSVAQVNGTLELVAKKGIGLAGKRTYLVPVIIFLVAGFLTIIGPGRLPLFRAVW